MSAAHTGPGLPRGFTLIEMLVALAVAAILLALALPSFQESIRKGRRADAVAALARIQQAQERYRANQSTYGALSDLAASAVTSQDGHYGLAVSGVSATGYTATATAQATSPQAQDSKCRQMIVAMNSGNVSYRSANAASAVDSNTSNPCWAR